MPVDPRFATILVSGMMHRMAQQEELEQAVTMLLVSARQLLEVLNDQQSTRIGPPQRPPLRERELMLADDDDL